VEAYRERALEDILNAERELRQNAERMAREYRALVLELAQRLAGEQLEARRRDNPGVPQVWTAADWTAFWNSVPVGTSSGWTKPNGNGHEALERRIVQLEGELTALRERLERAQAEAAQERRTREELQKRLEEAQQEKPKKKKGEAKRPAERILTPEELPRLWRKLVEEMSGMVVPPAPERFKAQLKPKESDIRYRRKVLVLYAVACGGISSRMEIDRVVSVVEGLSERTNSVRRPLDELVQTGLLICETIRMTSPFETGLAVYRLAEDGKALCGLWGWRVVENEWERLMRLHQGSEQEAHSVVILAFALHARLRGWDVSILPEVEGAARPDVLVERDGERWYVEVERGDGSRRKWKNLAVLNGGKVALCAANDAGREKLVRDCKAERLEGVATDLRTLSFVGNELRKMFDITPAEPLWVERW
jgi:regulator of replication initiation timing